jgi:anthranilate synthase component 1
MTTALSRPTPPSVSSMERTGPGGARSNMTDGRYAAAVETCKEAIRAGECFQIVPSQRFEVETEADPLDVYRVLRTTNPSPYMYLLRFDGFDIVGSSPEAHVKVTGDRAMLHPRGDAGGGRPARRRADGGPEGAFRARHARRPRP